MIEYIIKSTISLTILYFLYFIFLRNIKAFEFNRFFLLFVVIFSLIIPFIEISIGIDRIINQNIQDYSSTISNIKIQGEIVNGQKNNNLNIITFLTVTYTLISTIFLTRFALNLRKIIKLIYKSSKESNNFPRIVLSQKQALPYSFFQNIIVNKSEYENKQIDSSLIIHEQAHCNQYHSVDIIFIEIVKVFFWFNPIIWILKKEIQLNHEYLADMKVLQTQNLKLYQNRLINLTYLNNSPSLASNINYSITKKRLIMMSKNNSSTKSIGRKITIISLVLILALSLAFSQETSSTKSLKNLNNEWWYPILEKHKIEPQTFNNFNDIFEMGSSISVDSRIVTITDALFIIQQNNGYWILKSPLAYHNLEKNTISGDEGIVKEYKLDSKDTSPLHETIFTKFIFELQKDKKTLVLNAATIKRQMVEKK